MNRIGRILLLSAMLATALGCHHAGTAPPGWYGQPVATPDAHGTTNLAQGNGHPHTGTLEVVICYGKVLSNHTALRLTAPDQSTLFWDPGGTYKYDDPAYARRHDVLTENAPSIEQWWRYRRDGCREPIMEVYRWSIDTRQAERLHGILTEHADPADPTQTFEPDAGGLQCCKRISDFLMRFADDRPSVIEKYFWPHELGEHLWAQQPDDVTVYHADGPTTVYRQGVAPTPAE